MDFDLIVLGGGSGGIASAVRAAVYGAKVAVIEAKYSAPIESDHFFNFFSYRSCP